MPLKLVLAADSQHITLDGDLHILVFDTRQANLSTNSPSGLATSNGSVKASPIAGGAPGRTKLSASREFIMSRMSSISR